MTETVFNGRGGRRYLARESRIAGRRATTLYTTNSPGGDWTPLPMRLSWMSAVYGLAYERWPPLLIDALVEQPDGSVVIVFRDEMAWERMHVTRLDRESMWRAILKPGARAWVLERIRFMNYDGEDMPPV